MTTYNAENERVKHLYFDFMREAKRADDATVDATAKALNRFETYSRFRDFRTFNREQAVAFKRHLSEQNAKRTGERLSKATLYSTMRALRAFFLWLAGRPGFRSRLISTDAEFFNLPENDVRRAKASLEKPFPSLEQAKAALAAMPNSSDIERRDRALFAFILITGVRDGAVISLKLKHVDLTARRVDQDAREVNTKFGKSFSTTFFQVGAEVESIVVEWVEYLRDVLLWSPTDPLFPATNVQCGTDQRFTAAGLARKHWETASPIREIFRSAFNRVALSNFSPHTIRKTLVQLGERLCRTAEEFKAWSQNLGHEHVATTFSSYGKVPSARQSELIRSLGEGTSDTDDIQPELLAKVMRRLSGGMGR